MSSTLKPIADQLSSVISRTLNAYRSQLDEPIKVLALDFHPWNRFLALSVLTKSEVAIDPLLDDLAEMAAWKHYNFGANLDDWGVTSLLAEMKTIYDKSKDAQPLFHCCASAMASASVQQAVSKYNLAHNFRVSVANPDDNHEYYTR